MSASGRQRSRHLLALGLVLFALLTSGCLGSLRPDAPETAISVPPADEPADPVPVVVGSVQEEGVIRIQGDEMLDRSARRFGWSGTGSYASPYVIPDLDLEDTLLVFQDLTRAVTLTGATLKAPAEGPALLVWNVTAFTLLDSDVEAYEGPAVSFLEASWSRIEGSSLKSRQEAVQSVGSEAIDLLENDLRSGTTAIRFSHDEGDHWIERNRVHHSNVALHLHDSARSSSLFDNVLKGETGLILADTTAPLLEGNQIVAHDGIRIEGTDDALLLDTHLETTGTGILVMQSDRLFVDLLDIQGSGTGIAIRDSTLSIIANLSYEGAGPAVAAEGGRTTVVVDPFILLPEGEGEGIVIRNAQTPTIIDGEITNGQHAIHFNQTTEGTIIGTRIGNTRGAAIQLDATEETIVAETWTQAVLGHAIAVEGGSGHHLLQNRFEFIAQAAIAAQRTTDLDVAFNTFERGSGAPIVVERSVRPLIEGNILNHTTGGITLRSTTGGGILGNEINDALSGILVERSDDHPLRIAGNRITATTYVGITLAEVDDVELRGNALFSGKTASQGLMVRDVQNGLFYDNYFDNSINVAGSGELDIQWYVEAHPGTNVAGGDIIAGNWWSDYTGADADQDGVGDVPHGVLPYDETLGSTPVPNYGVTDEQPIVSDGVPDRPVSQPPPPTTAERINMLLGQHAALDRILALRA